MNFEIFSAKNQRKIPLFTQSMYCSFVRKDDHRIVFQEKLHFLPEIVENRDHMYHGGRMVGSIRR
jgi:hypothetical protein